MFHLTITSFLHHILTPICFGIIALISLPLNILCLIVLQKVTDIEDATKIFLKSLTCADIVFLLFRVVPAIGASAANSWIYGSDNMSCLFFAILAETAVYAMYLSVLAVNIDRCLSIVYPLRYTLMVSAKSARLMVVIMWLIPMMFLIFIAKLSDFHSIFKPKHQHCAINATNYLVMEVYDKTFHYLIILIILAIFGCFSVVISVSCRHQRNIRGSRATVGGVGHHRVLRPNSKAAITFLLMGLSQIVANVPWIISWFMDETPDFLRYISEIFFASTIWWDVVVYYVRNRPFRRAMRNAVSSCMRRR